MQGMEIEKVVGREILDSRGNPTIEVSVLLRNGILGSGIAPSGASTGAFEALELRDKDQNRYMGKGVLNAVNNVNTVICRVLKGRNVNDLYGIDEAMIVADGHADKSGLGANAILATSIACARAAANSLGMPLYRYLGGIQGRVMPMPLMNILNGGAHAKNPLDFQEFMIMPMGGKTFREALRIGTEVYHSLRHVLEERKLSTAVGDEGGFAPDVDSVEQVMELLVLAVEKAGYVCGTDVGFALDVAASEWKPGGESEMMASERKITGKYMYHMPKSKRDYSSDELIDLYKTLVSKYPVLSIEDPLDEEDWEGWKKITAEIGQKVQLVGDDLFVTNVERLQKGIEMGCANSILIKLNQIGTVTQTLDAIRLAHKSGYTAIVSHRSGETEDTTIADLAVALNSGQIKTGAPCRSERVAKYNRLLKIEEELGNKQVYFS